MSTWREIVEPIHKKVELAHLFGLSYSILDEGAEELIEALDVMADELDDQAIDIEELEQRLVYQRDKVRALLVVCGALVVMLFSAWRM